MQVHRYQSPTLNAYIDAFPKIFQPFIYRVQNVIGDGNCGFRAIADLLGFGQDGWLQVRKDLLNELHSPLGNYKDLYKASERIEQLTQRLSYFEEFPRNDRWMSIPDMGHLIASRYNVVLFHLSMQQCLTFLPLRSLPVDSVSRKEIAIGFVDSNHFVEVL